MRRPAFAVCGGIFVLAFFYFALFVDYGINFHDEGTLLYQIERTADGQTPYIDFHIGYTPAMYHLHGWMMQTFGYSVMPGRWLLVLVNTLGVTALAAIMVQIAPLWISWLPSLLYMVLIQVHPGEFAMFNIPYPVWYNVLFFVASILALLRFGERGHLGWLVAAGLLAGVNFVFKPNAGLLNLAVAGFCVAAIVPATRTSVSSILRRRIEIGWWWSFWLATLVGVLAIFSKAGPLELFVFIIPAVLAALTSGWRSLVSVPTARNCSIVQASLALVLSFLVVNLPWMAVVLARLGTQRFLTDVLFIGAGFEDFYYIEYPVEWGFVFAGIALAGALTFLPRMLSRFRVRVDYLAGVGFGLAALGLAAVASRAPMPEGFGQALSSEFEAAVFAIVLVIHAVAMVTWWRSIGTQEQDRLPSLQIGIVTIGAVFMYMQAYPRTDYTHWVTAVPLTLCVGIAILARLADRLAGTLPVFGKSVVRTVCIAPVVFYGLVRVSLALGAVYDLSPEGLHGIPQTELGSSRAPVRVNYGRAPKYDELSQVVEFVRANTASSEKVFTFPALDLVSFLSDRDNPTRHGYFYPRWPGHDWEAEVVSYLMADPPRFAVILHGHAPFFMEAPAYYFALGDFIEENYRPYARIGPYAVLSHRTLGPKGEIKERTPSMSAWLVDAGLERERRDGDVTDSKRLLLSELRRLKTLMLIEGTPSIRLALKSSDVEVRSAAVDAARYTRDELTANALARSVRLAGLSVKTIVTALRTISQGGGSGTVRWLVPLLGDPNPMIVDDAANALFHIANHGMARMYWFGMDAGEASLSVPSMPRRSRRWRRFIKTAVNSAADPRVRQAALWATSGLPLEKAEAVLRPLVNGKDLSVAIHAAALLAERGDARQLDDRVIEFLSDDDLLALRIALRVANDGGWDGLRGALYGPVWARQAAAWVAASTGERAAVRILANRLFDLDPQIRKAAIWGMHRAGAKRYLPELRLLEADSDHGVRAFALRAVDHLGRSEE